MVNVCPLCKIRVSEWMMASGKTLVIGREIIHKACQIDFKAKHGRDYGEEDQK